MSMRRVQHVDLRTSLEARIQYLQSFLNFDSKDIEALVVGSKYILRLIPSLVDAFYKKLLQYDITSRTFATRSTSYQGEVDEFPDENSPQIQYRKLFLRGYLQKLCSDPSKMEFWEYLDKVGMMHAGLGRKHPLNVEFVHLGASLGFIQDLLTEGILSHSRLKIERKIALVKAIGKVIWIQNDLFAKWHVRDGEQFGDRTRGVEIEKEGFLHGKRVLNTDDDVINMTLEPETPSEELSCPFSRLAVGMDTVDEKGNAGS